MKQFIYIDDDLKNRKAPDRIVVNRGSARFGEKPYVVVQLQWRPLPSWTCVYPDGRVESFRLTLEQVDEFVEILKNVKARAEAREKKETE